MDTFDVYVSISQQTFSVPDYRANTLYFIVVSVTVLQFCLCRMEIMIDISQMVGCGTLGLQSHFFHGQ